MAYLAENPVGVGWSLLIEPLAIYPHNDYLSYGIAFGVVCGALYAALAGWLLLAIGMAGIAVRDPCRIPVVLAGVGVTAAFAINSFSDHLTANRWYFNVTWSLIWFGFFASRSAQRRVHLSVGNGQA